VQERYEMYRSTLTFYSKVVGKRYNFVFVENSNVDLTSLKKEFEDKLNIEFCSLLQMPFSLILFLVLINLIIQRGKVTMNI